MREIAKCPEHPGGEPRIDTLAEWHRVVCEEAVFFGGRYGRCWVGPERRTVPEAIAVWGKVVGAVAEARALREALYPLVTGCLEADALEDAPEFDNDEAYNGVRALPECKRCERTGATDKKNRDEEPIPHNLLCSDCGGWGFLMHPNETP